MLVDDRTHFVSWNLSGIKSCLNELDETGQNVRIFEEVLFFQAT